MDDAVRAAWVDAVTVLGGDPAVAARQADELAARHCEPPRSYHDTRHVIAVLVDADQLCAELAVDGDERAAARAAACTHDVVYCGRAGQDERDSADWAARALTSAGVAGRHTERVRGLVVATAGHRAEPDDVAAAVLIDADLAVLAREPGAYADYVAAVRAEYRHVDDAQWRVGRSEVLRDLLNRDPLYLTAPARERWEAAARRNMTAELAGFSDAPAGG
ncbi:hypothetical protein [Jatrophihabitans endophyticus]|uniref:HD domain-containing protein n=1 Tax=Jatrophihabitans endophyticus TaxID=1206085 RepID=UPI001A09E663|nr:hypothetical protein [Jatrophihabitans endophyticus]MBE7186661.1 hypothetical protein [Jatrophihabitans endophyticus]